MAWDDSAKASAGGYYLLHSLPKFPEVSASGGLSPKVGGSEVTYGQHLACYSLSVAQLDQIAGVMAFSKVNTYYSQIKSNANTQGLQRLSAGVKGSTLINSVTLRFAGHNLVVVSKSNSINGSIFEDGLVNQFQSDFLAESWGRPLQDSFCPKTGFQVTNVDKIDVLGLQWK